jgi:SPP1 family predicted phage head-tail adaptor
MSAGELRERVIFQSRTPAEDGDGAGNFEGAWQERFRCAARLTPLKGSETVIASRLAGNQPLIIKVRSSAQCREVTTDWRILNARLRDVKGDPTAYNIRSFMNTDEKREYIDFLCDSGVAT